MLSFIVLMSLVICFSAILALALNFQWGLGGMINFGLAGLYALGAYACAIFILKLNMGFLSSTLLAMLIVSLACALISVVTLRVSEEDYFAIVTLGVGEMLRLVVLNEDWLTGGALGLSGIPRPFATIIPSDIYIYFFLAAYVFVLFFCIFLINILARSAFGRTMRAIREDDVVAATLGKNLLWARARIFAIGGLLIGLAGSMHAFYYQYIDPTQFSNIVVAYAIMAVIAGGKGSNFGVVIGSILIMLLLEGSRFLKEIIPGLGSDQLSAVRIIIIGVGLILVLIYKPNGFMKEYRLSVQ
jgi:branched-chain amino acid transport system permease protein